MTRLTSLYASLISAALIVTACGSDSNDKSYGADSSAGTTSASGSAGATNTAGTNGTSGAGGVSGAGQSGAGGMTAGTGGIAQAGGGSGGEQAGGGTGGAPQGGIGGGGTGGGGTGGGGVNNGGTGGVPQNGGAGGGGTSGGGSGGTDDSLSDASVPDASSSDASVADASVDGGTADSGGSGEMYTTTFPLSENPISEGGHWIDTTGVGIDWKNVSTTPGKAFGNQSTVAYSDPTAILTGTWGPTQTVTATVFCSNPTTSYYQEVEIRLRSSVAAHSLTGYEINFRCLTDGNAYTQIVRWNGPLGDFTYLNSGSGSSFGVANGDTVSASMVGNLISVFRNGSPVLTATDNTFTSGNPGIGFNYGVGATNTDFGFTSFTAVAQ